MARKAVSAPGPVSIPGSDLFEAFGGAVKCHELSTALYSRVGRDPALRHFFSEKSLRCAIEEFSAFLAQFLGGPSAAARHRWWLSLQESHSRFQIGQNERDAWLGHMMGALDDVEMSDPMRSSLRELFNEASAYIVNTGPAVAVPAREPALSDVHAEMLNRWDEQRALDDAVAAIREGELASVIAIVEGPLLQSCLSRNRAVLAQFAGVLIGSGHTIMAQYAERILQENPDLAHESYSGRSLLHAASAAGNLPIVSALLQLGVDPDIKDAGGHTPLYSVANECPGGGSVVRALIQAGANVNACDGVKRCTPMHMAARRGNVDAGVALLECGADIEARDSLGETPLRRAVNCNRAGVATLLLAKGADPHSPGSKGLTPLLAARDSGIRRLLQAWAKH